MKTYKFIVTKKIAGEVFKSMSLPLPCSDIELSQLERFIGARNTAERSKGIGVDLQSDLDINHPLRQYVESKCFDDNFDFYDLNLRVIRHFNTFAAKTFDDIADLERAIDDLLYSGGGFVGTWDNSDIEIRGYLIHDEHIVISLDCNTFVIFDSKSETLWVDNDYFHGETSTAVLAATLSTLLAWNFTRLHVVSLRSSSTIPVYSWNE